MTRVAASFRQFMFVLLLSALAIALFALSASLNTARADDFAVDNSMLLDPYDPVPQIHFSDYGCGDGCGYHRCWHDCGYRRCDYDCYGRDRCRHDCRPEYRCERECGPTTEELNRAWLERMHRYDDQSEDWHDDMHEWREAMGSYEDEWRADHDGHWHYWHDHHWHVDGDGGHWHDGGPHDDHHDDGYYDDGHHDGDHH